MHLNFWHYKSKRSKKGLAPVYLRITVNGEKAEISTVITIAPAHWNSKKCLVKLSSPRAKEFNQTLQQLEERVLKICNELTKASIPLSTEAIKSKLSGNDGQRVSLLDAVRYHNELFKKKVGIEKSRATYMKFESLRSKLTMSMKYEYGQSNLFLKELNHQFIVKFESYLKTEDRIAHNNTMKYIQQLKKIIHLSVAHGWIEQNPFYNFKCNYNQVHRGYLDKKDINRLESK
jgi:hypothetical protein